MNEREKIQKEIKGIIEKKYPIGKLERRCHGSGEKYQYFFWWRVVFAPEVKKALKKEFQNYEGIHLMPYYVDSNLFDKVKQLNHMKSTDPLPNLDIDSGNLHPCWGEKEVEEWCKEPSVKQVILVKNHKSAPWGLLDNSLTGIELTDIENIAGLNCYYPSPKEKPSETEPIEALLKGLLLQVLNQEELDKDTLLYKNLYEENNQ